MKLLSLLLVVVCFAYSQAESQGKELSKQETDLTEGIFKWEVEQAQTSKGDDGSDADDDDQAEGSSRKRRSAVRTFSVFNPGSYRSSYGRGYYYEAPARGAAFEVFGTPSYTGGYSGYVRGPSTQVGGLSFSRFFASFRPLRAAVTDDDVFVRSYVRFGSPDDCMADFRQLRLVGVRTITSAAVGGYGALDGVAGLRASRGYVAGVQRDTTYTAAAAGSYGLLGGLRLGGVRGIAGAAQERTVGYVGYLEDFPYQVSVLRSGCRLEEFPGLHDCIVFTGATYPYTRSVRKFVYVDRRYAAAVSGFSTDLH